jgi:hypothetical protein
VQFIERLFGLYPDAGNGLIELSLLAVLLSVIAIRMTFSRPLARNNAETQKPRN